MLKLVLVGAYRGKTVELAGVQFKEGIAFLPGELRNSAGLVKYLGTSYQAFLEGSPELAAAWEAIHGERYPDPSTGSGPAEPISGNVQPRGSGPVPEGADVSPEPAGSEGRTPGVVAAGDRSAEFSKGRILEALSKLDPKNPAHWNGNGKPAVFAVAELSGQQNVTRAEIERIAPNFIRGAKLEEPSNG